MKNNKPIMLFLITLMVLSACNKAEKLEVKVYETSEGGNKLTEITEFSTAEKVISIKLLPEEKFQTITGFGGAFTESSAYLLNKLSTENRKKIIDAYFSEEGANYSLTRTHMNSCDFSLSNYSYTPVEGDKNLEHFSSIVKLALADSIITEGEEKLLKRLAREFHISDDMYNEIIENPDKYPIKGRHSYNERIEHLYDLAKMIYADGSVSKKEASVLIKICVGLGFPIHNAEKTADEAIHLILKDNNLEDFTEAIKQVNKQ